MAFATCAATAFEQRRPLGVDAMVPEPLFWAVTGIFFMLIVSFGAAALGKRFRLCSIATMAIVLACGAVTGTYASDVQADSPTPWVGVWERISIATFMAWIVGLAIALLRAPRGAAPSVRATSQEKTRALPGDGLIEQPAGSLHHAISIRRPRHDVWPWLAQMGAGSRAGWYSYDVLACLDCPGERRVEPWAKYLVSAIHFPMQRKQLIGIAARAELTMSRSSAFKTADRPAARAR